MDRDQIIALLRQGIEAFKLEGTKSAAHMAEYGARLAEGLASTIGQPGYTQGVVAARDAFLLEGAAQSTFVADKVDAERRGIVLGLLHAAVGAIKT